MTKSFKELYFEKKKFAYSRTSISRRCGFGYEQEYHYRAYVDFRNASPRQQNAENPR